MKVICFIGKQGTGKSILTRKILKKVFNIILIQKMKDFSLILEYHKKKIGICSCGDNKKIMEERLKPLKEENCDIIICTSHTRGETIEYLRSLFNEENIEYIKTGGGEEHDNEKISQFEIIFNQLISV